MVQTSDPFDDILRWWESKPNTVSKINSISDTSKLGINCATPQGAFDCLVLGILYSIEDDGSLAEHTLPKLQESGLTNPAKLANVVKGSKDWNAMVSIFNQYYGGRLPNKKTEFLIAAANRLKDWEMDLVHLDKNPYIQGNEDFLLEAILIFQGIKIKAFWVMREMRMQGVWDISGKYCCVPDKQVFNALVRWGKLSNPNKTINLKQRKECSRTIWKDWGTLYDIPILLYSRSFRCNSKNRLCSTCRIVACADRNASLAPQSFCIHCGNLLVPGSKYCSQCGVKVLSAS